MSSPTECEICRFVFVPRDADDSESIRCPVCGIATAPGRTPTEEDDGQGISRGFWIHMVIATSVFLFCCVGAIVMSWQLRSTS